MQRRFFAVALIVILALGSVRADEGAKTEDDAGKAEETKPEPDLFTAEQRAAMAKSTETIGFQAEVNRLMEIIIHSLYKDREIFLREIISNAADACDKIRFLGLTDKNALGTGEQAELDIRLKFDKDAKTITITDKGIGMTREELIKNLGVVAKSGTTEFLEKMAQSSDLNLIGQFGVGFYSVYLVADKVTVASKSNNDPKQHVWESQANSVFTVAEDPRGNTLGRGTEITLHLKEDAQEFLNEQRIENLVTKYSQFINFPIHLWVSEEVEVEVPDEEAEKKEEAVDLDKETEKKEGDGEDEGEDAEGEKESKPKTKKVKETRWKWKRLNTAKPIWTRGADDIAEQEYNDFYQSLTKDDNGFLTKIHFAAEGEIAFKSILYIPKKADPALYDKFYEKSTGVKLYVRRVLIAEEFDEFLPRYLSFVKGVVDSDDLPLNVSRDTLAQSKVLKVMAKKLTRKVLEMLTRLASGKSEEEGDEDKEKEADAEKEKEEGKEDKTKDYITFWENFGKSIKLGIIDDRANKAKLSKLLRFVTSKSNGKFVSLEDYVERMHENQKYIYFITGQSIEFVENSPFLEQLKKRDLEVVYMTDPLDEYVTQTLTEFDGNTLMSITKEGLKFPGEKDSKKREEKLKEEFKDLTDYLKSLYGDKVEKVTISNRLQDSPAALVTGQYGWSANMERIMASQTFTDAAKATWMHPKRTMEINPRHPLIVELKKKAGEESKDKSLEDLANLLYDAAELNSGFTMKTPKAFADRIHRVISLGLGVDPNAPVPDAEPEVEDEPEPAKEDAAAEESAEPAKDEL